jgi:DNA-binding IscR family transcriptional regulator
MNARAMELSAIDEFILGNRQLHARFSLAIELLARIVIANPRRLSAAVLAEALGQPPRSVRLLLADLQRSGLVCEDEKDKDAWYCASTLNTITLADVFCSVAGPAPEQEKKQNGCTASEEQRSPAQQNIELLLMQATMEINQVVLQHLQAFDLGRLKALGSSGNFQRLDSSVRSYIAEPV